MIRSAIKPVPVAAGTVTPEKSRADWIEAFRRVRAETERRAAHLSAEDQIVQSMEDT